MTAFRSRKDGTHFPISDSDLESIGRRLAEETELEIQEVFRGARYYYILLDYLYDREAGQVYYAEGRTFDTIFYRPELSPAQIGGIILLFQSRFSREFSESTPQTRDLMGRLFRIFGGTQEKRRSEAIRIIKRLLLQKSINKTKTDTRESFEEVVDRAFEGVPLSHLVSAYSPKKLYELGQRINDNLTKIYTKQNPIPQDYHLRRFSTEDVVYILRAGIDRARKTGAENPASVKERKERAKLRKKFLKEHPGVPLPPELELRQKPRPEGQSTEEVADKTKN